MDILGVVNKYGFSTHRLAKEMGIKQSSIMSVVNKEANPTVKSLRNIANALKIPVWEFFADEMTIEEVQSLLEAMKKNEQKPEEVDERESEQSEADEKPADDVQKEQKNDELPFKDKEPKQESMPGVVICPHCKGRFVAEITFKSYNNS